VQSFILRYSSSFLFSLHLPYLHIGQLQVSTMLYPIDQDTYDKVNKSVVTIEPIFYFTGKVIASGYFSWRRFQSADVSSYIPSESLHLSSIDTNSGLTVRQQPLEGHCMHISFSASIKTGGMIHSAILMRPVIYSLFTIALPHRNLDFRTKPQF